MDKKFIVLYNQKFDEDNPLSENEFNTLILRSQSGDMEAKEELLYKNKGLVFKLAAPFLNKGLSDDDIIQEAFIGLIKTIDSYNIYKGFKFSTYATWMIYGEITTYIRNYSKTIRLSYDINISRLKKLEEKFIEINGYSPSDEELCILFKKDYPNDSMSPTKVKELRIYFKNLVSLNTIITDDDYNHVELMNFIKDSSKSTEEIALDNIQNETIRKIISGEIKSNLTDKERTFLKYRFGFGKRDEFTFQQIGDYFGITKEGARQIINKALLKLRKQPELLGVSIDMDKHQTKRLLKK